MPRQAADAPRIPGQDVADTDPSPRPDVNRIPWQQYSFSTPPRGSTARFTDGMRRLMVTVGRKCGETVAALRRNRGNSDFHHIQVTFCTHFRNTDARHSTEARFSSGSQPEPDHPNRAASRAPEGVLSTPSGARDAARFGWSGSGCDPDENRASVEWRASVFLK